MIITPKNITAQNAHPCAILKLRLFYFINIDITFNKLRDTKSSPNRNSPETSCVCGGIVAKTGENRKYQKPLMVDIRVFHEGLRTEV